MMDKIDYSKYIQYESATWRAVKQHLEDMRQKKVGLLIGSRDHDESNRIRGGISVIDAILAMDKPTA